MRANNKRSSEYQQKIVNLVFFLSSLFRKAPGRRVIKNPKLPSQIARLRDTDLLYTVIATPLNEYDVILGEAYRITSSCDFYITSKADLRVIQKDSKSSPKGLF